MTMAFAGSIRRIVAALAALMTTGIIARADDVNDYPTSARAEYVFGCLKANGETGKRSNNVPVRSTSSPRSCPMTGMSPPKPS
jgi:hypothetical protein